MDGTFIVNELKYDVIQVEAKGNCLYYALQAGMAFHGEFASLTEIKERIFRRTESLWAAKEEWFIDLYGMHGSGDSQISFVDYIRNKKKNGTWGSFMELYIFCIEFGVDVQSYTNAPGNSFASSIMRLQDQTVWSRRQFRPRYMFHIAYVNFPYIDQQNNHNHFVLLKTRHEKLTFHTMSNTTKAKTYVSALLSVSVPRRGFNAKLQEQCELLRRIPPPAPHTYERRRGEKSGVSKQGKPSQADRTRLTKRKDPHAHGQAD